jgi:hypothetical protein
MILTVFAYARGWFKINDNQTPNWANINNNQSPGWTEIDNNQG